MQNRMLEFSLVTQLQVKESIHTIFYESNNSIKERESFDDDLGLETFMGRLQIEDRR